MCPYIDARNPSSKTYIHRPQRRAQILAVVGVDEKEDCGCRKGGGAGTEDMLAASEFVVAVVGVVEPNRVIDVGHQDEVHEAG